MPVIELIRGLDIGGVDGGAERFGVDLSIALAQKGIKVEVYVFYKKTLSDLEEKWYCKLLSAGITPQFLASWEGKHRIDGVSRGIYHFLTARMSHEDSTIVHSHTQFGTLAAILKRFISPRIKVVRTAHVTEEWGRSLLGKVQRRILGELCFPLFTDTQVAVSKAVSKQVNNYIGMKISGKRSVIINNGIPIKLSTSTNRNYTEKDAYTIGTACRLTEQKGINYLISAMAIIHKNFPSKLLIAGEGELKENLQKQVTDLGLSNEIFFVGKTSDIYEFLWQLDLFVLPSLWEGLPTVVLESMAAGVPVIATNVPGTDELIEDGVDGWLVPPRDPQALAEKIIFALRSPHLRRQVSEAGRKKAEQFSIDKIADQYIDLFQKLLNE